MEKQLVIIGDLHGCIEELDELLKKISYDPNRMELLFIGDLIDRGPDSVGCVRRVMELGAQCIKGNHEDKHLRFRKHAKVEKETGTLNPMKAMAPQEMKINEDLSEEQFEWLDSLPTKKNLFENVWAVHAGCIPNIPFDKQPDSKLMRARYIDAKGKPVKLNLDKTQPENTEYWAALWKGPQSIVYGHCIHDYKVRWDNGVYTEKYFDDFKGGFFSRKKRFFCLGIDTGCCFGGSLTAALYRGPFTYSFDFVSVKAKQTYFKRFSYE